MNDSAMRQALRAAEVLRSAIITRLTVAKEPMTVRDLLGTVAVSSLTNDAGKMDYTLRGMLKAGLVQRLRVFRKGDMARFAYELASSAPPGPTRIIKDASWAADLADVKVDVLKAAGRLRITFKGLVIELGVEP